MACPGSARICSARLRQGARWRASRGRGSLVASAAGQVGAGSGLVLPEARPQTLTLTNNKLTAFPINLAKLAASTARLFRNKILSLIISFYYILGALDGSQLLVAFLSAETDKHSLEFYYFLRIDRAVVLLLLLVFFFSHLLDLLHSSNLEPRLPAKRLRLAPRVVQGILVDL
jgi:hypothetical protein